MSLLVLQKKENKLKKIHHVQDNSLILLPLYYSALGSLLSKYNFVKDMTRIADTQQATLNKREILLQSDKKEITYR